MITHALERKEDTMDKHIPKKGLVFYQPDLNIEYEERDDKLYPEGDFFFINQSFYRILYVYKGCLEVFDGKEKHLLKAGNLAICPVGLNLGIRRCKEETDFIKIWLLPSATIPESTAEFFRAFIAPKKISFWKPNKFDNKVCFELLKSLPKALEQKRDRSFFVIKLKAIIAELGFEHDEKYDVETYDKENISLKIIEYVKNNYSKKVTMQTLKDEFSVSESTINRIFRAGTGYTFSQFLNIRRLVSIKKILDDNTSNLSIAKIAELNGYATYSTFYRQYLAYFGEPPKISNNPEKHTNWPLS